MRRPLRRVVVGTVVIGLVVGVVARSSGSSSGSAPGSPMGADGVPRRRAAAPGGPVPDAGSSPDGRPERHERPVRSPSWVTNRPLVRATGAEPGRPGPPATPGRRPVDRPPRLVHQQPVGQPRARSRRPGSKRTRRSAARIPATASRQPRERRRAARPGRGERVPPAVRGVVVEVGDGVEQVREPPQQPPGLVEGRDVLRSAREHRGVGERGARPRPPSAPWPPPASRPGPPPPRAAGPAPRAGPTGSNPIPDAGPSLPARDHVVATLVPGHRRQTEGPNSVRLRRR